MFSFFGSQLTGIGTRKRWLDLNQTQKFGGGDTKKGND
ncbi:unnamed protein product [Rhodiola kirilowii]